jgi:uncharacterized protein
VAPDPERQCIGCGRRAPQCELVRLSVLEAEGSSPGIVMAGRGLKGRGAYLCRKQACLDRALQRKAFQRAFRATVVVDEEQVRRAVGAAVVEE